MAEEYRRIYNVGLLDDLHNYFPSLLYRPQLFNNVQDVLMYIQQRTAARFNLFNHGHATFLETEGRSNPYARTTSHNRNTVHRAPVVVPQEQEIETNIRVELEPTGPLTSALDAAILPLLRSLYIPEAQQHQRIFRGTGARVPTQFQDVVVHATQAQIDAGSSIQTADGSYASAENSCAICQDRIVEGDIVRHLNVCRHDFHRACIDNWFLNSSVRCPTCRHDIRDREPVPTPRQSPQLPAPQVPGPTGPLAQEPMPTLDLDQAAADNILRMLFGGFR